MSIRRGIALSARWPRWKAALVVGLAAFVVASVVGGAVAAAWARGMREPRVVVLGAGKQLSVFVTSRDARFLIATGDDPVAFTNALDEARELTTRRIDVLLIAGRGESLLAPVAAHELGDIRYVASLGPLADSAEADALGDAVPALPTPRRFQLPGGVSIVVEVVAMDEAGKVAWSAVIRHGDTAVAVVSDGEDVATLPPLGPVAAVVLAGGNPEKALAAVTTPALVVSADAVSGRDVRRIVAPAASGELWTIRVFPGEAVRLDFVSDGLRLPGDRAQLVPTREGV
jgi:hypothetical protein